MNNLTWIFFFQDQISPTRNDEKKCWSTMSMQFFKADPIIAFISPCLLFVMPKSLSAVEHPGNFAYSAGKSSVFVHNFNGKRWFITVWCITINKETFTRIFQWPKVMKSTEIEARNHQIMDLGNFLGSTWRWNFKGVLGLYEHFDLLQLFSLSIFLHAVFFVWKI